MEGAGRWCWCSGMTLLLLLIFEWVGNGGVLNDQVGR